MLSFLLVPIPGKKRIHCEEFTLSGLPSRLKKTLEYTRTKLGRIFLDRIEPFVSIFYLASKYLTLNFSIFC